MDDAPKRRWLGFSRKAILITLAAIVAIELPLALLAITSTIPYHWGWIHNKDTITVIRSFWDGRREVEDVRRTVSTDLIEFGIASFAAVVSGAAAAYLILRWLKRGPPPQVSLRTIFTIVLLAAILLALVAFLAGG
jgi:hypothetical protein